MKILLKICFIWLIGYLLAIGLVINAGFVCQLSDMSTEEIIIAAFILPLMDVAIFCCIWGLIEIIKED